MIKDNLSRIIISFILQFKYFLTWAMQKSFSRTFMSYNALLTTTLGKKKAIILRITNIAFAPGASSPTATLV